MISVQRIAKPLYGPKPVSRVRIPPSPPLGSGPVRTVTHVSGRSSSVSTPLPTNLCPLGWLKHYAVPRHYAVGAKVEVDRIACEWTGPTFPLRSWVRGAFRPGKANKERKLMTSPDDVDEHGKIQGRLGCDRGGNTVHDFWAWHGGESGALIDS